MHAHIATKLSAFAVAFALNGLMILGVSYLSREQPHECAAASVPVDAAAQMPDPIRV